jgi:hypothetical protein
MKKSKELSTSLTPEEKAIWEQIYELKELTKLTGIIHEAQIQQLHLWARLVGNGKYTIAINVDERNVSIKYSSKILNDAKKNFKNRGLWLSKAVKVLLGDDWKTEIYFKKTKVY